MNAELLRDLKRDFGTVSQQTANSGVVAVRNKTHRKLLAELVGSGGELMDLGTSDRYPRLIRVITKPEVVGVDPGTGLTTCCSASTTFHDETECCKNCWKEVAR